MSKEKSKAGKPKEKPKTTEEEYQGLGMRYTFFKAQGDAAARELQNLDLAITDLATAKVVLEDIKTSKEGESVLIPIGGNSFLNVNVSDVKHVLTGIGADVIVRKPIEEVLGALDENLNKLGSRERTVVDQVQISEKEMAKLGPEIAELEAALKRERSKGTLVSAGGV